MARSLVNDGADHLRLGRPLDAIATLQRAVELGGTVAVPLMPIPGVGWLVYAKDPDGNIFGMMQNDPTAK